MSDNKNQCEHGIDTRSFRCGECPPPNEPTLGHPMQGTTERPVPDSELVTYIAIAEKAMPNEGIPVRADVLVWLCKNFRETRSACADLVTAAEEERKEDGVKVEPTIWDGLVQNARRVLPA